MTIHAIAPAITTHFSQCESSGGIGRLSVYTRGPWTVVSGRKTPGTRVLVVPSPRGNFAPLWERNVNEDLSGQEVYGDGQLFTLDPLDLPDEATQQTSMLLLRKGYWYTIHRYSDWDYAQGNHYLCRRLREESGV